MYFIVHLRTGSELLYGNLCRQNSYLEVSEHHNIHWSQSRSLRPGATAATNDNLHLLHINNIIYTEFRWQVDDGNRPHLAVGAECFTKLKQSASGPICC